MSYNNCNKTSKFVSQCTYYSAFFRPKISGIEMVKFVKHIKNGERLLSIFNFSKFLRLIIDICNKSFFQIPLLHQVQYVFLF